MEASISVGSKDGKGGIFTAKNITAFLTLTVLMTLASTAGGFLKDGISMQYKKYKNPTSSTPA